MDFSEITQIKMESDDNTDEATDWTKLNSLKTFDCK